MSVYDERPWLARYRPATPSDIEPEYPNALAMFRASVETAPDRVLIRYFDGALSLREVDEASDALASCLIDEGFAPGDRMGVYLQNVPQFVISMLAAWKAGGIMLSINPMYKEAELRVLLEDSGATALVCHPALYEAVAAKVVGGTAVRTVVSTSELEYQTRNDERLFKGFQRSVPEGTLDFSQVVEQYRGRRPSEPQLGPDDTAFLVYTSGTTGPPKGAMTTHRNIVFNAQSYRDWISLGPDDTVLGVAPLFHITGLIGHIAVAMLLPATLVLAYRFEPGVILETIR
ncbi:MAG: AMP-binding protein, partial [Acidimicrobiales bacterium]